jgi:hypothetical protein
MIFVALAHENYAAGFLDLGFGNNGIVTTDLGSEAMLRNLYLQTDGKILALVNNNNSVVLLRYNSNGSLDTTFGNGGKVVTVYASSDNTVSLTAQTDGLIAVGNNSRVDRYSRAAKSRRLR